jgi:hypothetical protein
VLQRVFLAGLVLSLAACAPIVEAQFPDVEVTRPDISIPPAPTAALSSVTFSFSLDSSKLGASSKPTAQEGIVSVKLHRLALTAKTGILDLSFIQTLHALACVPTSKTSTLSARQVEIADYARVSQTATGATFEVPILEPVDLLPLLRPTAGEPRSILVIVNLGGELPTTEWKADISMSLAIEIRQ